MWPFKKKAPKHEHDWVVIEQFTTSQPFYSPLFKKEWVEESSGVFKRCKGCGKEEAYTLQSDGTREALDVEWIKLRLK